MIQRLIKAKGLSKKLHPETNTTIPEFHSLFFNWLLFFAPGLFDCPWLHHVKLQHSSAEHFFITPVLHLQHFSALFHFRELHEYGNHTSVVVHKLGELDSGSTHVHVGNSDEEPINWLWFWHLLLSSNSLGRSGDAVCHCNRVNIFAMF